MPTNKEIAEWLREVEAEYRQLSKDIKAPFNSPARKAQIKWGKRAKQVEQMRCETCEYTYGSPVEIIKPICHNKKSPLYGMSVSRDFYCKYYKADGRSKSMQFIEESEKAHQNTANSNLHFGEAKEVE